MKEAEKMSTSGWEHLQIGDKIIANGRDGTRMLGIVDDIAPYLDTLWIIDSRTGERSLVTGSETCLLEPSPSGLVIDSVHDVDERFT